MSIFTPTLWKLKKLCLLYRSVYDIYMDSSTHWIINFLLLRSRYTYVIRAETYFDFQLIDESFAASSQYCLSYMSVYVLLCGKEWMGRIKNSTVLSVSINVDSERRSYCLFYEFLFLLFFQISTTTSHA